MARSLMSGQTTVHLTPAVIRPECGTHCRITYKCERCGAVLDRDYNAALNLMKLGLVKPE